MIEPWKFPAAIGLLISCCILAGCGDANPLGRQPIAGEVTFDGQPMDAGSISFRPQGKKGIGSGGPIRNGHYQIETAKGLPPGEYIVRITSPVRFGDKTAPSGPPGPESLSMANGLERVPEKYNAKSTLVASVSASGGNTFDFDIEKKKK